MTRFSAALVVLLCVSTFIMISKARSASETEVERVWTVLDELHHAASIADGQRYFAVFAPDAVFLGTDASERWPITEFRRYAQARFDTGTGWTYHLRTNQRNITIAGNGQVAWFDELLENAKYGVCRGSGVLRQVDGHWRIAQYNLSIPIPNDMALEVVGLIRESDKATAR